MGNPNTENESAEGRKLPLSHDEASQLAQLLACRLTMQLGEKETCFYLALLHYLAHEKDATMRENIFIDAESEAAPLFVEVSKVIEAKVSLSIEALRVKWARQEAR